MKTRDELSLLCNDMGLTGEAVEIGVDQGFFTKVNLANWKGVKYWLVDPWMHVPGYPDFGERTDWDFQKVYENIVASFINEPRIQIMRLVSSVAVHYFKNESLDWVYIDANHEYDFIKADIAEWFPKVKKGGIFSGHDYAECKPGIIKAVDEFINQYGYTLNLTNEEHGYFSWWVVK